LFFFSLKPHSDVCGRQGEWPGQLAEAAVAHQLNMASFVASSGAGLSIDSKTGQYMVHAPTRQQHHNQESRQLAAAVR
jgi:hypothetical protein